MPSQIATGAVITPGHLLFSEVVDVNDAAPAADSVEAGAGCYARLVEGAGGTVERHVVASRLGVAQWEGPTISVYPRHTAMRMGVQAEQITAVGPAGSSSLVFGPRPGDIVHLRVTRVTRLFAFGEIIAINSAWSSISGSAALGRREAFRGVIRVDDIRPFKPARDQLQPPPPSAAYQPGDVVVARVISQSDARQYELSTAESPFGVVESVVSDGSGVRRRLRPIPGRRDAMVNPADGVVYNRWCPQLSI